MELLALFALGFLYPTTIAIASLTGAAYACKEPLFDRRAQGADDIGD